LRRLAFLRRVRQSAGIDGGALKQRSVNRV
jgi:hypothetical protein